MDIDQSTSCQASPQLCCILLSVYCFEEPVLIERDMKGVTVVVMSLLDGSPDRPADCPRLDLPVNEMTSRK